MNTETPTDQTAAAEDAERPTVERMVMRNLTVVLAYWPDGRSQHMEFDHWPMRDELPDDAVRFDIAWPYGAERER